MTISTQSTKIRNQREANAKALLQTVKKVVRKHIYKFSGCHFDAYEKDRLWDAAIDGLLIALDKHDPNRGKSLNNFAWLCMNSRLYSMMEKLLNARPQTCKTVKLSISWASDKTPDKTPHCEVEEPAERMRSYTPLVSLDAETEDGCCLYDSYTDTGCPAPGCYSNEQEALERVYRTLHKLPAKKAELLCAKFGIERDAACHQYELAQRHGVSEARVSQLVGSAKASFRSIYCTDYDDVLHYTAS